MGLGGSTTPPDVVGTDTDWGTDGVGVGVWAEGRVTRFDDMEDLNSLPSAASSRCRSSRRVGGGVGGGSNWSAEGRCGEEASVSCRVGGRGDDWRWIVGELGCRRELEPSWMSMVGMGPICPLLLAPATSSSSAKYVDIFTGCLLPSLVVDATDGLTNWDILASRLLASAAAFSAASQGFIKVLLLLPPPPMNSLRVPLKLRGVSVDSSPAPIFSEKVPRGGTA